MVVMELTRIINDLTSREWEPEVHIHKEETDDEDE